jgi:DNA-directed RNA polymerase specialized sigma24 family protein
MSIGDTAKALGKKEGTVRALTSQGVSRLRQQLGASWMEVRDE